MAQLVVRDIEDEVKEQLRRRAKAHRRSMEEEVRDILRNAVAADSPASAGLGSRIAALFADCGLDEPILELRGWHVEIPDLSGDSHHAK